MAIMIQNKYEVGQKVKVLTKGYIVLVTISHIKVKMNEKHATIWYDVYHPTLGTCEDVREDELDKWRDEKVGKYFPIRGWSLQ